MKYWTWITFQKAVVNFRLQVRQLLSRSGKYRKIRQVGINMGSSKGSNKVGVHLGDQEDQFEGGEELEENENDEKVVKDLSRSSSSKSSGDSKRVIMHNRKRSALNPEQYPSPLNSTKRQCCRNVSEVRNMLSDVCLKSGETPSCQNLDNADDFKQKEIDEYRMNKHAILDTTISNFRETVAGPEIAAAKEWVKELLIEKPKSDIS